MTNCHNYIKVITDDYLQIYKIIITIYKYTDKGYLQWLTHKNAKLWKLGLDEIVLKLKLN
jgi:hypothetical protein